jgi:hypothetical protein
MTESLNIQNRKREADLDLSKTVGSSSPRRAAAAQMTDAGLQLQEPGAGGQPASREQEPGRLRPGCLPQCCLLDVDERLRGGRPGGTAGRGSRGRSAGLGAGRGAPAGCCWPWPPAGPRRRAAGRRRPAGLVAWGGDQEKPRRRSGGAATGSDRERRRAGRTRAGRRTRTRCVVRLERGGWDRGGLLLLGRVGKGRELGREEAIGLSLESCS